MATTIGDTLQYMRRICGDDSSAKADKLYRQAVVGGLRRFCGPSGNWWNHYKNNVDIQFATKYSARDGTVTVVNGSTTVTGTGTSFTADMALQMIRLGVTPTSGYRIASVNVGLQTLTLETPFVSPNDTDAIDISYTVVYTNFALPWEAGKRYILVDGVWNPQYIDDVWAEMDYTNLRQIIDSDLSQTSYPTAWQPTNYAVEIRQDDSRRVWLWPTVDRPYAIRVTAFRRPDEPVDVEVDATVLDVPDTLRNYYWACCLIELGDMLPTVRPRAQAIEAREYQAAKRSDAQVLLPVRFGPGMSAPPRRRSLMRRQ